MTTSNEILEQNNQKEAKNSSSSSLSILENKFLNKIDIFIEYELQKDITYFQDKTNINGIWEKFIHSLNDDEKKDFKIFLDDKQTQEYILKRKILEISTPLINLFIQVQKAFEKDFIFKEKEKEKFISDLKKQNISDLESLFYKQTSRQKFLKSIGLEDVKIKENTQKDQKLLEDIFLGNTNAQNKILADPDALFSLKKIAFIEPYKIHLSDFDILLNILDENEKKALIEYFIPMISIQDAVKYGLLSDEDAKKAIKKDIESNFDLNGDELNEIVKKLDTSYFFIQTNTLTNSHVLLNSTKYTSKIIQDINSLKDDIEKETNIESISDFHTTIAKNENISDEIKNKLSKLNPKNYIKLHGENIIPEQYFYINEIQNVNNKFLFTNITLGTKISRHNTGKQEESSYLDFIQLLEQISKTNGKTKINFYTEKEINDHSDIERIADIDEISSSSDLEKFLQEVDPEGKDVKINEMAFYAKDIPTYDDEGKLKPSSGDEMFFVKNVSGNNLTLDTGESFSFQDFAQIFQARECKRFKRIDTPDELLKALAKENEHFKDLVIKDGKIKPKNKENDPEYPGITYFIGEGENSFCIKKIGNNIVDFDKGEYKEGNKKDKPDSFQGSKIKGWHYTNLFHEMKGKKLQPKEPQYVNHNNENTHASPSRKGSLLKSYMGMWSIAEMLSGGKQIITSIQHSLEMGNKLKSAKFALALGKFLPESVRQDLQSMVEGEEKKTMEELLSHLTTLDSKVMIPKIVKIITNKSSHQYEVEAALAAMYSKYGTLYNKHPLNTYRGSFIWYEALGGKVGDALYIETKRNCEEAKSEVGKKSTPKPFTEEYLIEQLLGKQANGDLPPKRRSKIHKEIGGHLSNGIKAELEDGASKAGNQITIKGRIDYALSELKNGGYSNGLGAVEKIWAKGGTIAEMHAIPFIITMTGMSKYFPEELLGKMISTMGWSSLYTELVFNKDAKSITLFQEGMEAIVQSFNNKEMLQQLQGIGNNVEKAYIFWSNHGEKIVDRMIGKDGYIFINPNKDPKIAKYYETLSGIQNDDEYNIKKEDIDNGFLKYDNNSLIYTMGKKLATEHISFLENGKMRTTTGSTIFDMYLDHLKAIKNIDYLNDEEKFKLFYEIYSTLEPMIRSSFGRWLGGETMIKSREVQRLKSYGIDLINNGYNIPENEPPTNDTIFGYTNNPKYEEHVKKAYENFKNIHFSDGETSLIQNTKHSIGSILNMTQSSVNDENIPKRP